MHEFKVTGTEVCHCLNYYTPAGFEQASLGRSRPAERRAWPPPGLDAPNSPSGAVLQQLLGRVGHPPVGTAEALTGLSTRSQPDN